MPSRNRVKLYAPDTYYHIYACGVEKRQLFLEQRDYVFFLFLLKRYLSGHAVTDKAGRPYADLSGEVELLAYCLMPSHIHLLIYQRNAEAITRLLRRVLGSYSIYFNKKYFRVGTLFHDRYKAALIDNDAYLWHISRYIHLNPLELHNEALDYPYSSFSNYAGRRQFSWLKPERILALQSGSERSYVDFAHDYNENKRMLNEIKVFLANIE